MNCTFERSDFCGWINVRQIDDYDWVLNSGRTMTPFTGPGFDHTLGEPSRGWGIYAYVSAVNKPPGSTSRLVSPALTGYTNVCLQFWYLMYGNAMGTLRVYKRLIGGSNAGDVLSWEMSGNQGRNWTLGDVRMAGNSQEVFQIVFESTVGPGTQSDIAIDDITVLFDEQCQISDGWNKPSLTTQRRPATLTSGQFIMPSYSRPTTSIGRTYGRIVTYPTSYRGTTRSEPSNQQLLFCNFDNSGSCNWIQDDSQDDFEWHLNRGLTPSRNTGPMADHTTGSSTGSYLYLEASSPRRVGDLARLKSPLITNQPLSGCLHFWYSMYGSGIGELRVLSTSAADGSRRLLWRLVGEQGPDWLRGQVWVDLEPSGGKIYIEGIVGLSYLADIAIDDLSFTGERCETIPQHAGMMPEEAQGAEDEQHDTVPSTFSYHVNADNAELSGSIAAIPISTCSFAVSAACNWQFMKDGDAYWYHSRTYPLQGTSQRSSRCNFRFFLLFSFLFIFILFLSCSFRLYLYSFRLATTVEECLTSLTICRPGHSCLYKNELFYDKFFR